MTLKNEDYCDCKDCEQSEFPCARDCQEDESECQACKKIRENRSGAV